MKKFILSVFAILAIAFSLAELNAPLANAQTDSTAPAVVAISDDAPASRQIARRETVRYTVAFSEPVTNVDVSDFGNAGTAAIAFGELVAISATEYQISITPITAGTLRLQINPDAVIEDSSGNRLATPVFDDDLIQVLIRRPRSSPS